MNQDNQEVRLIPIDDVNVLNPRSRNKKTFAELVESISNVGLKRPVTVSQREDGSYNLVCGQGRLEAFIQLGQKQIPAIVVEASQEDCYVMSLVENLARRQHSHTELLQEFATLKARGYSEAEIACKMVFTIGYVHAILHLLENGEERLLTAVERGVVPYSIALEIARAKDGEVQAALAEAYANKSMPGSQILAIRTIVEQRNKSGKAQISSSGRNAQRPRVTSSALINAYRKETLRQRTLARKAAIAEERLAFLITALRTLLADERFPMLLKAEQLLTLPQPLATRLQIAEVQNAQ